MNIIKKRVLSLVLSLLLTPASAFAGNIAAKADSLAPLTSPVSSINIKNSFSSNAEAIVIDKLGGYDALCSYDDGSANSVNHILKIDKSGNIVNTLNLNLPQGEYNTISSAPDGGYYIGSNGQITYSGYDDQGLFRVDSQGNVVWSTDLSNLNFSDFCGIQATSDGGCVATFSSKLVNTVIHMPYYYIIKLDSKGNVTWNTQVNLAANDYGIGPAAQLSDGRYVIGPRQYSVVGGLVGSNGGGTIKGSDCQCTVTGADYSRTDGFAGTAVDYYGLLDGSESKCFTNITNCHAKSTVSGGNSAEAGGFVGSCSTAAVSTFSISNCYATGSASVKDLATAGGFMGDIYSIKGKISNCYTSDNVKSGNNYAISGGFVGCTHEATLTNCYATGSVSVGSSKTESGGFVGRNSGNILNCYGLGNVTGGSNSMLGGFVGIGNCGFISNCYETGSLKGGSNAEIGGFVGYNDPIIDDGTCCFIKKCYWNTSALQTIGSTGRTKKRGVGNLAYNATASDSETIGLQGGLMKSGFTKTLNNNVSSLKLKSCASWKYVNGKNSGLPVLTGVGDGK